MKPTGRSKKALTEDQIMVVKAYLESSKGYREIAEEFNIPFSTVKYLVAKYRKSEQGRTAEETNKSLLEESGAPFSQYSNEAALAAAVSVIEEYKRIYSLAYEAAVKRFEKEGVGSRVHKLEFDLYNMQVDVTMMDDRDTPVYKYTEHFPLAEILGL